MILYEDSEIVVCHKPAGIPVQSASVRVKDMVSILKNQTGGEIYVVHRLDQPVEGVLVFAKTKKAAANLSRQVTDGSMKKIYHAVAELSEPALLGGVSQENGVSLENNQVPRPGEWQTLVDYLIKDTRENRSFVVDDVKSESRTENGKIISARERDSSSKVQISSKNRIKESGVKRAELRYRILRMLPNLETTEKTADEPRNIKRCDSLSANARKASGVDGRKAARALVEIDLKSGRHHQIRVQMAHAGMPLVGDRKYNPEYNHTYKIESNSEAYGIPAADDEKNLALCAVSLTFRHPSTKKKMTYEIQPHFSNLTE